MSKKRVAYYYDSKSTLTSYLEPSKSRNSRRGRIHLLNFKPSYEASSNAHYP